MNWNILKCAILVASLAGAWAAGGAVPAARAETFRLTSLEWPPYSGTDLPDQGFSVRVARAAFEAMGHSLEVDFFPWKRAVQTGLGPGYVGYFPEYYAEDLATGPCAFSEPAGSGPLGFVESVAAPVTWASLDDLQGRSIGTVSGYVNTAAFDARAADGSLAVEPATDDLTNLRKVAAGRLDLAVIDARVLDWLLAGNPELEGQVRMNDHLLEDKALFVCFQKSVEGDAARAIFNDGLGKIDIGAMMSTGS